LIKTERLYKKADGMIEVRNEARMVTDNAVTPIYPIDFEKMLAQTAKKSMVIQSFQCR